MVSEPGRCHVYAFLSDTGKFEEPPCLVLRGTLRSTCRNPRRLSVDPKFKHVVTPGRQVDKETGGDQLVSRPAVMLVRKNILQ